MLAHWAKQYEMPAQLLAHESAVLALRDNQNVMAGVFEAYVGAMVEACGWDTTLRFVGELVDAQLTVQPERDVASSSPAAVSQDCQRPADRSPKTPPPSSARAPTSSGGPQNRLSGLNERAAQLGKILAWSEASQGPEFNKSWKMTVTGEISPPAFLSAFSYDLFSRRRCCGGRLRRA